MSLSIDRYVKWGEIWSDEVCLQTSSDCLEDSDSDEDIETFKTIEQFKQDKDVELDIEVCCFIDSEMFFFFSESGGQNESDTQGWSRNYYFTVNSDFLITYAHYEQS